MQTVQLQHIPQDHSVRRRARHLMLLQTGLDRVQRAHIEHRPQHALTDRHNSNFTSDLRQNCRPKQTVDKSVWRSSVCSHTWQIVPARQKGDQGSACPGGLRGLRGATLRTLRGVR